MFCLSLCIFKKIFEVFDNCRLIYISRYRTSLLDIWTSPVRAPVTWLAKCCLYCTGICTAIWIGKYILPNVLAVLSGPGSSVGKATELRAGRSGIESRCGRDFPPVQTGPGAHPSFCKMGTGSFPGLKCGRSVLLTTHPLLVPRSWKSRAIPLPTLWATPGL